MSDAPRGWQPDDLYRLKTVTDPQISPDGARVAFVVGSIDREENGYRAAVWLVNADGSGAHPLTAGSKNDGQPRWSPDGRTLAFTSNRDGRQQLYLLPLDGGEPRRLTNLPQGVLEYALSPDSATIAFTSRTGVSEEKDAAQQPRVITTLKHKFNGQGFTQGRRHVFAVPAAGGEPRQITDGDFDDAQLAWSADGKDILFISARHAHRDRDQGQDLWAVPAAGGEARPLTDGFGVVNAPVVSPDGATIAFVGHDEARDLGARPAAIWLLETHGAPRNLLAGLDRGVQAGAIAPGAPPTRIAWTDNGAAIVARIQDGAAVELRRIALADGALRTLAGGQRVVEAFSVANDGTIACAISDPEHPAEVYLIDRDGGERRLSGINDELIAALRFPAITPVHAISADGTPVEGWVIKPLDQQPGARYPLVLNIHGGPHGAFMYSFRAGYPLTLAALGCAVLEMNPRGSTGWGEAFAMALHGGRGEWDLPDLLAGVDAVIAEGWIDPERLGITGYSYGGYMTAWGITQSDRFKAAVWGAGTANLYVHFAYSDINVPRYAEMKGSPWEQRETYLRQSPISYVQNVRTPLLMLHGEADLRCNIAQAEEFFTALKYFEKEAVFVRYPGENHMMPNSGKPTNRVDYVERTVGWFRERLALDAGPTRAEHAAVTAAGE